jgi:MoxR-like ATPase
VRPPTAAKVLEPEQLTTLQAAADDVFVHDALVDYAVRLVLATREPGAHGLGDLTPWIAHGASPRATLGLVAAGRALALMRGRHYAIPQDIYDVSRDVLRHRVLLSYEALADGITAEAVTERVVTTVGAPRITPVQDTPVAEAS